MKGKRNHKHMIKNLTYSFFSSIAYLRFFLWIALIYNQNQLEGKYAIHKIIYNKSISNDKYPLFERQPLLFLNTF